MKKYYHYIVLLLFLQTTTAQTLFTDNFDSYTIGNLGTDMSGTIPGQGGWMTKREGTNPLTTSNSIQVVAETGRGKVLQFSNADLTNRRHVYHVYQPNINTLIDWRTVGNNVIALQFDFFTGAQIIGIPGISTGTTSIILHTDTAVDSLDVRNTLLRFIYDRNTGEASIFYKRRTDIDSSLLWAHYNNPVLPFNTWVTFKIYLDYNNQKIYAEDIYHNKVYAGNFLEDEAPAYLLEKYKPKYLGSYVDISFLPPETPPFPHVYTQVDNITLTALKSVPPHVLSAESFLATKFNIYPNPATDVVNITNSENILVNKATIYDITGKQLSTQNFNNESDLQLNVAHLASGTYMLHLQTNEGTAVKKLVKK